MVARCAAAAADTCQQALGSCRPFSSGISFCQQVREMSFNNWITIGVTGALEIPNEFAASVRQGIEEALLSVKNICPDANLRLLTGMAPGADRLAAEIALEIGDIWIQPILPLPEAVYVKTFPTINPERYWAGEPSRDLSGFLELIEEQERLYKPLLVTPEGPIPLNRAETNGVDWEMLAEKDEASTARRRQQYALAGLLAALRANHLLVVYDGGPTPDRTYGTYGIERTKLRGLLPGEAYLKDPAEEIRPTKALFDKASLEWNWANCGLVERIWVGADFQSERYYLLAEPDGGAVACPKGSNPRAYKKLLSDKGPVGVHWDSLRQLNELARDMREPAVEFPDEIQPYSPKRRTFWAGLCFVPIQGIRCFRHVIDSITATFRSLIAEPLVAEKSHLLEKTFGSESGWNLGEPEKRQLEELLRYRRRIADHAASLRYRLRTWIVWVYLWIFAGTVFFQLYVKFGRDDHWAWLGYSVTWLIALVLYQIHRKKRLDDRTFDYRAISEALRIEIPWRLAHLPGSSIAHYLDRHSGELGWIRQYVEGLIIDTSCEVESFWIEKPTVHGNQTPQEAEAAWREARRMRFRAVLGQADEPRGWVVEQSRYFTKNIEKRAAVAKQIDDVARAGLSLGVTCAIGGGLAFFLLDREVNLFWIAETVPDIPKYWLMACLMAGSVVAIGAGLWGVYSRGILATEERNAFASMAQVYRSAQLEMTSELGRGEEADLEKLEQICVELGREALDEQAEWLILHRARRFAPASGL